MDEQEFPVCADPLTMLAQPNGRGLSYFVVDMRQNGGLGAVVQADQRVYAPAQEALCAIKHANGHDYWLVINQDSSGIASYSVTATGVSLGSSVSMLTRNGNNMIKASPDGRYLVAFFFDLSNPLAPFSQGFLFEFDNTTGQFSNPVGLPLSALCCEFSPNSRYLFALQVGTGGVDVVQYDLQAPVLFSNGFTAGTIPNSFGSLQLAPDGKIYNLSSNSANNSNVLNRITCPNTTTPGFESGVHTFPLGVDTIFLNLPNFPSWLFSSDDATFVTLGPDTVRICEVGGSYVLNALNPGATYLWSTGDTTQTITVTAPGNYSVIVNGLCGSGSDEIVFVSCCPVDPVLAPSRNITACASYTTPWGITYTQSGIYVDTVAYAGSCDSVITINLNIKNHSSAQQDVFSCGPYTTPDGTLFEQSGSYSAIFTAANACDSIVTYNITVSSLPPVDAGAGNILITEGDTIQLNATGAVNYVWSPSEGLSCNNCPSPLAFPRSETLYTVTGTDAQGCAATDNVRIRVDLRCNDLFLAELFSPDGVGPAANEKLCLYGNCIRHFSLIIYNRWGEQVFETTDVSNCWEGLHKGRPSESGLYAYTLYVERTDGSMLRKSGTLTLLR